MQFQWNWNGLQLEIEGVSYECIIDDLFLAKINGYELFSRPVINYNLNKNDWASKDKSSMDFSVFN